MILNASAGKRHGRVAKGFLMTKQPRDAEDPESAEIVTTEFR
jgi:hypothetical protein